MWGSPASSRHHVHLNVLLLLVARGAPHLGHQAGVPHPHGAPVAEILGVKLLVQRQVAGHDGVAAPGPGQAPPAQLGVVALAGLDERRGLPGGEGGARPGDGRQGPHPAPAHCQGEARRLRLLKWETLNNWIYNESQAGGLYRGHSIPPNDRQLSEFLIPCTF